MDVIILNEYKLTKIWVIGQKVCVTNPNKPGSCLNDVARSIQLHLPT